MQSKWLSRKFIVTLVFAFIVVSNAWYVAHRPLTWQDIAIVGAVLGVYNTANAIQKGYEGVTLDLSGFTGEDGEDAEV